MSAAARTPRSLHALWGMALAPFVVLATPRMARACGVTTGGAAGITGCSLEEHEEETRRKWDVGASYSFTSTSLTFSNGQRVDEQRHASLVTLDYALSRRTTLRAGAGVLLGGDILDGSTRFLFSPGFVGVTAASWRVLDADGAVPFVLLTGAVSFATTQTDGVGYSALDVRAGSMVGWTLWSMLTPFVVGRAFGGPVFWQVGGASVTGTDVYHYQVGGGFDVRLGPRVDLYAEAVPLGERGVAVGTGMSF